MSKPLLFDDFEAGAEIASANMTVPENGFELVRRAFPDLPPTADLSHELTIAMLMRAYTALVQPRPPGNIHAEQTICIHRLLAPGQGFTGRAICESKERKAGRNWVQFALEIVSGGELCVKSEMRFVWAK